MTNLTHQITRRDPFDAFLPVERLFNTFLRDPVASGISAVGGIDEGTLAIDVSDTGDDIVVRASLPGYERDDISVEFHDGVLNISASREESTAAEGEKFYRRERRFGSVSRRVALPVAVQDDAAKAELKDGVLTLRLPKAVSVRPKKISID